jgi:hypothetical protein
LKGRKKDQHSENRKETSTGLQVSC